ncbi:TIGR03279 family radical SAM protein [Prochlorococcus marinus]|uniref:TIGR03279 family radical SAM protein n=1 Tax=Prochlorococcus marinus TaxID=1219 RepID=UPI0022B3EBFF|nr:TIGR03279 family radical SAM protein [Prochlorococcus marinus]
MWNEISPEIDLSAIREKSNNYGPKPALVESVEPGSIGEELGFEAGDKLVSVNGIKPRDLIDYRYLTAEETLDLEILDKNEVIHKIQIEKDVDEGLGINFSESLFDGLKQCNNDCPFCFIDQQPSGHRESLYLKDDDYRLSFLYGSYLTLTNLTEKDWLRIEKQRLSPLFISIHSTNEKLRIKLLKNPRAGMIMEQIQWFAKRKLQLHAQIVVCPGINDGENLKNTLNDLFEYGKSQFPTILSTAIVPVGLTRFRPNNDNLKPVTSECAKEIINLVEELQVKYQTSLGSRFAWLSDEWYLLANKKLPKRLEYEDMPQEENGVGSIRSFLESMNNATKKLPKKISIDKNYSWVVGKLVEQALHPIVEKINRIEGLSLKMYGLNSPYWGQEKVVTGLLTGQDLIDGLKGETLGDKLLLPSIMLRNGESTFLDDMTVKQVEKNLRTPIKVVYGADDLIKQIIEVH